MKIVNLVLLFIVLFTGCKSDSSDSNNTQSKAISERQLKTGEQPHANENHIVVLHLEHPEDSDLENDLDFIGSDCFILKPQVNLDSVELALDSNISFGEVSIRNMQDNTTLEFDSSSATTTYSFEKDKEYEYCISHQGNAIEGEMVFVHFHTESKKDATSPLRNYDEASVEKLFLNTKKSCRGCNLSGYDFTQEHSNFHADAPSKPVDLTDANLSGAKLHDMNLNYWIFSGADLSKNDTLKRPNTEFKNSKLINAKLIGADLSHAKMYNATLDGADLSGANVTNADFSSTSMNNTIAEDISTLYLASKFKPRSIDGASFANSDLSVVVSNDGSIKSALASFSDELETKDEFDIKQVEGVNFTNTFLKGIDFTNIHFTNCDFREANLSHAVADYATFDKSDFIQVDARDSSLNNATFTDSAITRSNFNAANMENLTIEMPNNLFEYNYFTHTFLKGAYIIIRSALYIDFSDANLTNAKLLTNADFLYLKFENTDLTDTEIGSLYLSCIKTPICKGTYFGGFFNDNTLFNTTCTDTRFEHVAEKCILNNVNVPALVCTSSEVVTHQNCELDYYIKEGYDTGEIHHNEVK